MNDQFQPLEPFSRCSLSDLALLTLELWLERSALVSDINIVNRNRYLLDMTDQDAPIRRIQSCQRGFRKLWRAVWFKRVTDIEPRDRMFHDTFVVKPHQPWTTQEAAKLIDAAHNMKHGTTYMINGIHRAGFWESFVRLTQETRLHRTMLQTIRWEHIDRERRVLDLTSNLDVGMMFHISEATLAAIETIRYPEREFILDYHGPQNVINAAYQRLLKAAKVDYRPGEQHKWNLRKAAKAGKAGAA